MLVLCQLLHVLLVLLGVQDATMPVPYFMLFFIPENLQMKYSRNWTKHKESHYFTGRLQKPEGEVLEAHRGPTPTPGAAKALPAPMFCP
jgi:hypothetical protein